MRGTHKPPWQVMPTSLTSMPKSAPSLLLAQPLTRDSFYPATWGCYLIISASTDATGMLLGVLNQVQHKLISPLAFCPSAPGRHTHVHIHPYTRAHTRTHLRLQGIGRASDDMVLLPVPSYLLLRPFKGKANLPLPPPPPAV